MSWMAAIGPALTTAAPYAVGFLGAASIALPFMGGGDDEDDGPVDQMDPAAVTQRARNFYSGQGEGGVGLDFMPQKKYVMQNFYAADGGRAAADCRGGAGDGSGAGADGGGAA